MPRPRVFDTVPATQVATLYVNDKHSTRQIASMAPSIRPAIRGLTPAPGLRGPGRWLVTSWLSDKGVALRPPQEGADLVKALTVAAVGTCVWPNCCSAAGREAPFEALCAAHAEACGTKVPGWDCAFGSCVGPAVYDTLWCSYHGASVRRLTG